MSVSRALRWVSLLLCLVYQVGSTGQRVCSSSDDCLSGKDEMTQELQRLFPELSDVQLSSLLLLANEESGAQQKLTAEDQAINSNHQVARTYSNMLKSAKV